MHIEEVDLVKDDTADENGITDLMRALKNKENLAQIKRLIDNSADVNAQTNSGWTPIMLSVIYNSNKSGITQFLLDKGANVDAQTTNGKTVLMTACESYKIEKRELLIKAGTIAPL